MGEPDRSEATAIKDGVPWDESVGKMYFGKKGIWFASARI